LKSNTTTTVRPEPVEGLFFFLESWKETGQGFDRLSPNGLGGAILQNKV
jgi:hypothetical protein